jgi:hypothetical protein
MKRSLYGERDYAFGQLTPHTHRSDTSEPGTAASSLPSRREHLPQEEHGPQEKLLLYKEDCRGSSMKIA